MNRRTGQWKLHMNVCGWCFWAFLHIDRIVRCPAKHTNVYIARTHKHSDKWIATILWRSKKIRLHAIHAHIRLLWSIATKQHIVEEKKRTTTLFAVDENKVNKWGKCPVKHSTSHSLDRRDEIEQTTPRIWMHTETRAQKNTMRNYVP